MFDCETNHGKRVLALELDSEADQQRLWDLLKVADVLIDVPNSRPGALFKAVDTGLDALLTVPKDKLGAAAIEEAFSGLDTNTCDLVPLPSPELFSKFKDTEVAKVDAAKLKAAVDVLKETTKSVKRTDTGVCLPSPEALTICIASWKGLNV